MKTAKWCNQELNASRISSEFVIGEMKEVIEAIVKLDMVELKEEIADVAYFSLCWLEGKYGINLPMVGAGATIDKVIARLDKWREIFNEYGLAFDKKYLVGGSNYKKQSKIDAAISMARLDQ